MLALNAGQAIEGLASTGSSVTYTVTGALITATGTTTYEVLSQGVLGTSAGAMYTVPSGDQALVSSVLLANTTNSSVSVTMFVDGGALSNQIGALQIPVQGMATLDREGWKVYSNTGSLQTIGATGPQGPAGPAASSVIGGNVYTSSWTVTSADFGNEAGYNSSSAGIATIQQGLTPNVGQVIVFRQLGTGALTIAGGVGVTFITGSILTTPGQARTVLARQTPVTDTWAVA